jgi:(S)-mandelate dehydrogenase
MRRRRYRGTNVERALTIEDLRQIARRRTPNFAFEYVEGGAEEEVTLRRNRAVFDDIALMPRTLVDVSNRRLGIQLFGRESALPIVIGPTGVNGFLTHEGDLQLALAAAGAGIPFTLSTVSTVAMEDIVRRAGGRLWMQLYVYRDREWARRFVERVERAGCEALVLTVDTSVPGLREWDLRNFRRPMQLDLRNKLDILMHPRWLFDVMIPHGLPRLANVGDLIPPGANSARNASSALGKQLDPSLSWKDVAWLRDLWPRTLIIKGISGVEDALLAAQHGADGIVLSNHGGRQLDGAVSPMEVLPAVEAALNGRLTIMLDSGFRRGSDIVKALLLGADAVLLGRAAIYGLAAGGQPGAARSIEILRTEVERVIGLLGCNSISSLDPACLRWRGAGRFHCTSQVDRGASSEGRDFEPPQIDASGLMARFSI